MSIMLNPLDTAKKCIKNTIPIAITTLDNLAKIFNLYLSETTFTITAIIIIGTGTK